MENRTVPFFVIVLLFFAIGVSSAWAQQEITKQKTTNEKEITILIIDGAIQPMELRKGFSSPWEEREKKLKINPGTLAEKFNEFMKKMESVFKRTPKIIGDYTVDEIELHLSIDAEGGINLIGKATVGMTTGIKVILKRRP